MTLQFTGIIHTLSGNKFFGEIGIRLGDVGGKIGGDLSLRVPLLRSQPAASRS